MAEQTMVERVARAIAGDRLWERLSMGDLPESDKDVYRVKARAAIEAMREPTDAMLSPCTHILSHFDGEYGDHNVYFEKRQAEEIWLAMIDVALAEGADAGEKAGLTQAE